MDTVARQAIHTRTKQQTLRESRDDPNAVSNAIAVLCRSVNISFSVTTRKTDFTTGCHNDLATTGTKRCVAKDECRFSISASGQLPFAPVVMPSPHSAPGGFLHSSLLSPPPSSTTSTCRSILPAPRSHPLRSGSAKESTFINHVDQGIMQVTRKYATKFSGTGSGAVDHPGPVSYDTTQDRGYESFGEVARDIERLLEVVWVSGTRKSTFCLFA